MNAQANFQLSKAIFLDRDGTINVEKEYLYKSEDFEFIPGTIEAIKIFHDLGYKVIVITNQSGVARGYYTEENIDALHNHMTNELEKAGTREEGYYIDAYYYCPHHPKGTVTSYTMECNCRKPNTGMIKRAMNDLNLSLDESIIIGDKEIDIQAGKNIGVGMKILVRSGHFIDETNTDADMIFDNLYSFALSLIK